MNGRWRQPGFRSLVGALTAVRGIGTVRLQRGRGHRMGTSVRRVNRSKRPVLVLAFAAGVGTLVASAAWASPRLLPVVPRAVEGWAQPNAAGTAISLHDSYDAEWGEGYIIAGADWRSAEGPWNDGASSPTCVGTDTAAMTHVRLGVVMVKVHEGSTREQVVWLQCLE